MKNQFDELAKGLAQPTTRRQALKKFGVGLAGMALACFGLAESATAGTKSCLPSGWVCTGNSECCSGVCVKVPGGRKNNGGGNHYTYCQ